MQKNIHARKNTNTKITKLIIVLLVVVVVYLSLAWAMRLFPFSRPAEELDQTSQSAPNANQQQPLAPSNQLPVDQDTDSGISHEPEKNLPSQYEGPNPNLDNNLTGSINYKSISGGKLVLRVTIEQSLGSGRCDLTLTNTETNKTYTETAKVINNPSSSSCDGFDIPVSKLSRGWWNLELKVSSENKTGLLTDKVEV